MANWQLKISIAILNTNDDTILEAAVFGEVVETVSIDLW
tara:strand:- start:466 stop:582 length:117 start_codon:yes stop_codon:yes gene_type:complete